MRVAKVIAGFVLLLAGIAMLALPGPGWLTIVAGLALLAAEYAWARRALDRVQSAARTVGNTVKRGHRRRSGGDEADRPRPR
jgi:uncharacterized protein (TIGR02611 family)